MRKNKHTYIYNKKKNEEKNSEQMFSYYILHRRIQQILALYNVHIKIILSVLEPFAE